MATEIFMPRMGYDMTEGKLVRWLKHEGDAVSKGEAVAEIETDKVVIEVEAFAAGVLRRIEVAEGSTVPVGTRIGIVAEADEALPAAVPTPRPAIAASAPAAPAAASSAPAPAPARGESAGTANASPLARRLAHEHGIDLATVTGSGPGGKISREDILAAVAAGTGSSSSPTAAPVRSNTTPTDEQLPLSRLRQTMGRRMLESKSQAPHFYLTMQVDMTEAMARRERLNAEAGGAAARVSVNDLIVKASADALRAFPAFNAAFAGDHLELRSAINICVAVAMDDGLVTPVLHEVDGKSLTQIAQESAALVERTRAGKNRSEDYEGGTFTVSNLGMYKVDTFTAIINPPQAAILAVGAVRRTPVYIGDDLVPRAMLNLTLSTDHRIADGAAAARFLGAIREALEQPANP